MMTGYWWRFPGLKTHRAPQCVPGSDKGSSLDRRFSGYTQENLTNSCIIMKSFIIHDNAFFYMININFGEKKIAICSFQSSPYFTHTLYFCLNEGFMMPRYKAYTCISLASQVAPALTIFTFTIQFHADFCQKWKWKSYNILIAFFILNSNVFLTWLTKKKNWGGGVTTNPD